MASGLRRKSTSTRRSFGSQRSSSSFQKSEVYINVYDLLPVTLPNLQPCIASRLTRPARQTFLPPLVSRIFTSPYRCRYQVSESRIRVRRTQPPRSLRCLQHPARSTTSRWYIPLLHTPRLHPPHTEGNPKRHPRNRTRVSRPQLQPPDKQLQPLLELLVREADREGRAELDESGCDDWDRLAVYCAQGVGRAT